MALTTQDWSKVQERFGGTEAERRRKLEGRGGEGRERIGERKRERKGEGGREREDRREEGREGERRGRDERRGGRKRENRQLAVFDGQDPILSLLN